MIDVNIKDIIGPDDEYLLVEDGRVSAHSSGISGFLIEEDIDLKVIYAFTRSAEIEFQISEGVRLNITEIFMDFAPEVDATVNYTLKPESKVNLLSVKSSKQNGKTRINANINLFKDAYIKLNEIANLPGSCELVNRIFLNEKGAELEMKTVTLNSSGEEQTFSAYVFHNSGTTASALHSYGISANASELRISTDGIIKSGSSKSELRQNTKGLILDSESHVSASPILEIDDFDVVAAHGASIGAIDEEMLYYLMSRGIPRTEAERLVIAGFINPFLEAIPQESLKEWISALINSYLR